MPMYLRNGCRLWKRIPRRWDDQEGMVLCRLVDVKSSSTLRKWCREGDLYMLCGLYLLPVHNRATRHYLLRCLVDGQLFLHTNRNN